MTDALDRGRSSFGRRAWADAHAHLLAADHASPLGPDDLERLAMAAHLLGRDEDSAGLADPVADDELASPAEAGTRAFGHSKDHRADLPQVVIAMAVTRDGIPVRCWTFPGNTRRRALLPRREAAPHQHRGRRRAGPPGPLPHRGRQPAGQGGRGRTGGDGDGDDGARTQRFVICHNPEQGERDQQVRTNLVAHLAQLIDGSDTWTARRRDELVGSLRAKPGLRRYLRRTSGGLLRVDQTAIRREAHLDGKWLLRTSDTTLTPDDLAAAYKQLLAVEHGWRDFKGALGLRPVFHYREDRIRAHIQLCWLALLLLRVIENATGDTWRNVRHELDRMHLITLATDHGRVAQRSATTPGQRTLLQALDLPESPRFFDFASVPSST